MRRGFLISMVCVDVEVEIAEFSEVSLAFHCGAFKVPTNKRSSVTHQMRCNLF